MGRTIRATLLEISAVDNTVLGYNVAIEINVSEAFYDLDLETTTTPSYTKHVIPLRQLGVTLTINENSLLLNGFLTIKNGDIEIANIKTGDKVVDEGIFYSKTELESIHNLIQTIYSN